MNRAATVALAPISGIYGIFVKARNACYRQGIFRKQQVGVPVVSVGNLTSGGTGKTPLVEWIARELASMGRNVCVLTRGYGRDDPSPRVVASNRKEILADVKQTGDEAFMLAERLKGEAAVICDADRISAAGWAIENLGSDVFVLDDAFQHQQIARDLNILTVDATNPWGNRRSIPSGILREPISELSRSDCVIITRADSQNPRRLHDEIEKIHPGMTVLLSRMKHTQLREVGQNSSMMDPDEIKALSFGAFCGIGNSESFFSLLRSEGYSLAYERSFRDHYNFRQTDVDEIVRAARDKGAQAILTTAKDAAKLRSLNFALTCYVAEIEIEIDRAGVLRQLLLEAIKHA
jgi:tetraacyldisaccharide 4'-kinase